MPKEKHNPDFSTEELTDQVLSLILHNDEVNTFDYIIESLIEVCNHDEIQAEQSATIAHYRGKCDVLSGVLEELRPPYKEMLRRNITVSIE